MGRDISGETWLATIIRVLLVTLNVVCDFWWVSLRSVETLFLLGVCVWVRGCVFRYCFDVFFFVCTDGGQNRRDDGRTHTITPTEA